MNYTKEKQSKNRRAFLRNGMTMGAAVVGATALSPASALAQSSAKLSPGDIAILRFLAAAELIEADLWQQYTELGGVTTGPGNPYQTALENLDGDAAQYIASNTVDELSHAEFLNAYLLSKGAAPVDFDRFRVLPSSQVSGIQQIGRLTNLTQLSVDTSFYTRYRSDTNPD